LLMETYPQIADAIIHIEPPPKIGDRPSSIGDRQSSTIADGRSPIDDRRT